MRFPIDDKVNDESKDGQVGKENGNGFHDFDERESSDSDDDSHSPGPLERSHRELPRVAIGFNDGRLRIYEISDTDEFILVKSLPPVTGEILLCYLSRSRFPICYVLCPLRGFVLWFTGRVLSVTWSADANYLYSGSSDGYVLKL